MTLYELADSLAHIACAVGAPRDREHEHAACVEGDDGAAVAEILLSLLMDAEFGEIEAAQARAAQLCEIVRAIQDAQVRQLRRVTAATGVAPATAPGGIAAIMAGQGEVRVPD